MNYRHAYHAGNFADVVKHATLTLVIEHMKLKPGPFRIIDTHAGIGDYDLASIEAQKTGEWREGIGRLLDAKLPPETGQILAPYLSVVRKLNPAGAVIRYPGSPRIARELMRSSDHLVVNELHPEDHKALARLFAHDPQVKVMSLDAWTAVKALLPPPERRGLVLIDPAFEQPGELDRLITALKEGIRRFAGGTYLLWYPIKEQRPVAAFRRKIADLGLSKATAYELTIRDPQDETRLNGAGLIVINGPFTLAARMKVLLPELARILQQAKGGGFRVENLGSDDAADVKQPE